MPPQQEEAQGDGPEEDELGVRAGHAVALAAQDVDVAGALLLDEALQGEVDALAGELAEYKPFVGVDGAGEPNGAVNEDARYLINAHSMLYTDLEAVGKVAEKVPQ